MNPRRSHSFVFLDGGTRAAADNRARVAHAASRRRCLPGDQSDDRLFHMVLDVGGGLLFRVAADFADHHDGMRFGIFIEELDRIEMSRANDWIAADADARGLSDAELRQLMHSLICQCSAAAHDADVSLLVNPSGHDAHLAFSR